MGNREKDGRVTSRNYRDDNVAVTQPYLLECFGRMCLLHVDGRSHVGHAFHSSVCLVRTLEELSLPTTCLFISSGAESRRKHVTSTTVGHR